MESIKDGKIINIGSYDQIKTMKNKNTLIYDLEEKTVLPGLIEGHIHLFFHGENSSKINLLNKNKEEILSIIKEKATNLKCNEWIIGHGWDNDLWDDKNYPTKNDLDNITREHPIFLQRICGHMAWLNSKALEIAGINNSTSDPEGGKILRDENNLITGCLTDMAILLIWNKMPVSSDNFREKMFINSQNELLSYGITSCMNADSTIDDIQLMKKMYKEDRLIMRIYNIISGEWGKWFTDQVFNYLKEGIQVGLFDDKFTSRGIKVFADGSLGSRSAALFNDYDDLKNH